VFQVILTVHLSLCLILIGLVLIQQGKGADAGAIMGGGTESILGAGSAGNFISRLTTGLAIGFMITSIMLVKSYQQRSYIRTGPTDPLSGSVILEGAPAAVSEDVEEVDVVVEEDVVVDVEAEGVAVTEPEVESEPAAEAAAVVSEEAASDPADTEQEPAAPVEEKPAATE